MKKRTARLAVAAAAFAVIAPLAGCANMLSADQTANYEYNGGDGAWSREDLEGVDVRGLLILQNEEGDAHVFYSLINGADETRQVTMEIGPETVETTLQPGESFHQNPQAPQSDAEPLIVSGLNAEVGSLVDVEVTVGSASETIRAQVLDDSLPEYADLMPTAPAEDPTTDPTEGATDGTTEEGVLNEDGTTGAGEGATAEG
ncbi:MAG TPA: hypothetical protein K8V08_08145 [Brevibacterium senegalense]|uniref:DNA modification methylase n=1 Tax=Brevibacterium senegalense TaxID=1033736 RepID=A0A921SNY8_9MICO|nr:hypothetical protein [Brevibacterium senegalense]